ncbi:MAG: UbiA family prenyltransferase [Bacilli bacterium]|nr:UbiA family prenyltransferase [Bacilli bacterium]
MKKYIKIMRIDHWIKQLFILPGFICAMYLGKFPFKLEYLLLLIVGLFATSLIASANYVINEYLDREFDRFHPVKKKRVLVSEDCDGRVIWLLWFILSVVGLFLGKKILGLDFFMMEIFLLVMGLLYNVKPMRTKDVFILDVLSESVNNAIRLLLGWFILPINIVIPVSMVLGYWMTGAFLMAIKRYAEYLMINDKKKASLYRRSFKYYTDKSLLTTAFFYAMTSIFFIGIFLIKYRIELVLFMPFLIGLYCYYFYMSFDKDSAVQKPEKLYKERGLMTYLTFLIILFVILMNINIEWLNIFLI